MVVEIRETFLLLVNAMFDKKKSNILSIKLLTINREIIRNSDARNEFLCLYWHLPQRGIYWIQIILFVRNKIVYHLISHH